MVDFTEKTVLVTGAASGIGEAIAVTLGNAGAFVYVADIDEENGHHVANELTNDEIRANCIYPGRIETPFVRARINEYDDPEKAYREMAATQAQGRMGTPEEIAASVLYLSSGEAAFTTGTALIIDGGFSVGK